MMFKFLNFLASIYKLISGKAQKLFLLIVIIILLLLFVMYIKYNELKENMNTIKYELIISQNEIDYNAQLRTFESSIDVNNKLAEYRIEDLLTQNTNLENRIIDIESELKETKNKNEVLSTEIGELKIENQQLKTENKNLRTQIEFLNVEYKKKIQNLENEKKKLSDQYSVLLKKFVDKGFSFSSLLDVNEPIKDSIINLKNSIDVKNNEIIDTTSNFKNSQNKEIEKISKIEKKQNGVELYEKGLSYERQASNTTMTDPIAYYLYALKFYKQALENDYPCDEAIKRVQEKINSLEK